MQLVSTIPDGYYALAISIIKRTTPDEAFELLDNGCLPPRKMLEPDEVAEMARLKETMTYRELAELYGMKRDAVYNRIRRFKGRV